MSPETSITHQLKDKSVLTDNQGSLLETSDCHDLHDLRPSLPPPSNLEGTLLKYHQLQESLET